MEPNSQTNPAFRSIRAYTLSLVKKYVIDCISSFVAAMPSYPVFAPMLNGMGYRIPKTKKCRPLKKISETDAIFEEVRHLCQLTDDAEDVVRVSRDNNAVVMIGPLSRGDSSRKKPALSAMALTQAKKTAIPGGPRTCSGGRPGAVVQGSTVCEPKDGIQIA